MARAPIANDDIIGQGAREDEEHHHRIVDRYNRVLNNPNVSEAVKQDVTKRLRAASAGQA
ncbi:hypothetical protein DL93DRAFT_2089963 [Clavulina sp. PMI_390]|nr:hypothetical protein DL93DRAFT_2089963 [Clavulina sp. PMI_390]